MEPGVRASPEEIHSRSWIVALRLALHIDILLVVCRPVSKVMLAGWRLVYYQVVAPLRVQSRRVFQNGNEDVHSLNTLTTTRKLLVTTLFDTLAM